MKQSTDVDNKLAEAEHSNEVDYALPFNPTELSKCPLIKSLVERAEDPDAEPLSRFEVKVLAYTFGFLKDGRESVLDVLRHQSDSLRRYAKELMDNAVEKKHLAISCVKIRDDYALCQHLDCRGSITPIKYCFGEDPNIRFVRHIALADLAAEHLNRYVKVDVYICGMGEPCSVPYLLHVLCKSEREECIKDCEFTEGCQITLNDIRNTLGETNLLLEFVGLAKDRENQLLLNYVKKYARAQKDCHFGLRRLEVQVLREKTVTPLVVMDAIDEVDLKDAKAREASRRRVYLIGTKRGLLRRGRLIGPVLKHPHTGQLTILAICLEPTEIQLEAFKLTPEHQELFSVLQNAQNEYLFDIIGTHVCGIYGRPLAIEANLIAYLTPLYIRWKNEVLPGWVQITNFGDTTTGKGIPRDLRKWLNLGIYSVIETASRTGLLYFIDQSREGSVLGFGEFVLADRTLIIIDGANKLNPEERAEFRESYRLGYLKVRRVVSGSAPMRVRVINCENVKKPLSEYMYPCTAITENYQGPDIARLDLAIPYRREDVPSEIIFKDYGKKPTELPKLQEAIRNNTLWAWSRTAEQIVFEPDAVEEIFKAAKVLEEKFGNNIVPLVSKDMDKKLAKLSAGYAAFKHSCDQMGEKLLIKKEHVQHVSKRIDQIYSSEGMRLDQHASIARKRSEITDQEYGKICKEIELAEAEERIPLVQLIIREMQLRGSVHLNELMATVGEEVGKVSRDTIIDRIGIFKKHYLIVSGQYGYTLTPKGISFINRYSTEATQSTGLEEEGRSEQRENTPPLNSLDQSVKSVRTKEPKDASVKLNRLLAGPKMIHLCRNHVFQLGWYEKQREGKAEIRGLTKQKMESLRCSQCGDEAEFEVVPV